VGTPVRQGGLIVASRAEELAMVMAEMNRPLAAKFSSGNGQDPAHDDVREQIAALELSSLRCIRELLCGNAHAMNTLQSIEDRIIELRDQLG
jgi:hypothetical protein